MSQKSEESVDNALELLLDTICNTFGGVLFISLLVIVMLNVTSYEVQSQPASERVRAQLASGQRQLAATSAELAKLETAVKQQSRVERIIVNPELKQVVRELRQTQQQSASLLEKKSQDLKQIANSQQEINRLAEEINRNRQAMQNAQQDLLSIERQLQREIQARTRAAKLPRVRTTTKAQMVLFLRAGRLTSFSRFDRAGVVVVNDAEVQEQRAGDKVFVEPKTGVGVTIDLQGNNLREIDQRLNEFNPQQHFIAVAVWADSFPHFAVLKDRLVSRGFEYQLEPIPDGERVPLGESAAQQVVQ